MNKQEKIKEAVNAWVNSGFKGFLQFESCKIHDYKILATLSTKIRPKGKSVPNPCVIMEVKYIDAELGHELLNKRYAFDIQEANSGLFYRVIETFSEARKVYIH